MEPAGIGIEEGIRRCRRRHSSGMTDLERGTAQGLARFLVEIGGGSAFDDFLVAPLDRTVALEEMDEAAVAVAKELDFEHGGHGRRVFRDRPRHCRTRALASRRAEVTASMSLSSPSIGRMPLPPASPARLEHHRVADIAGQTLDLRGVARKRSRRWLHRYANETARSRAATLLPSVRIDCARGPMKMMPAAAQASAKSGFSESKP